MDYTTLAPLLIVYRCSQLYCWRKLSYWSISPNWLTNFITYVRELTYHIGDVIASMLASNVVDCGLETRSGQPRDLQKNGIFCFSDKHTALRSTSKRWLVWNQNNVSKWSDMFTRGLLFQWASKMKIQISHQIGHHQNLVECTWYSPWHTMPWYRWKLLIWR